MADIERTSKTNNSFLMKLQKQIQKIIYLLLAFVIPIISGAQTTTISGYVIESGTQEALINASVYSENDEVFTYTNDYGFFSLQFKSGITISLTASYVGYEDRMVEFVTSNDSTLNFSLNSFNLQTVEVTADKSKGANDYLKNLEIRKLVELPTLGGEQDILKALTFYPGVTIGAEGTSELFVRGGTSDQNLYLLDQIPVFNVTHLGGFLSVFNADAIQNIDFYKSGFPARYAGRLSSVVDISLKEGSKADFKGKYSIGVLTSKISLEGPLSERKNSSFLIAARSSYLGLVNLFRDKNTSDNFLNYWLYDLNAKVNFTLGKGKFYASFYSGLDNGTNRSAAESTSLNRVLSSSVSDFKVNWGNQTLSTRYTRAIGSKLFLKSALGFTRYEYNNNEETTSEIFVTENVSNVDKEINKYESSINSLIARIDLDYNQNNILSWRSGIYAEHQSNSIDNFINPASNNSANFLDIYIENRIELNRFKIESGLRMSNYFSDKSSFNFVQPRFKMDLMLSEQSSLVFSYSRMVQFLHQLTINSFGLPVNTWLNSSPLLKPETSDQFSLAFNYKNKFLNNGTIELFHKKQNNLIEYRNSNQEFINADLENTIDLISTNGEGEIYGVEMFLSSSIGKISLTGAYTLSWNYRQFDDLNNGKKYLFNFDRRNDVSLNASYPLNAKWNLSSTFVYQSGSRFTGPVANIKIPGNLNEVEVFGGRNNIGLPDYHRLDLSIKYSNLNKKKNLATWNLTVYNLYNRANVNSVILSQTAVFDSNGDFVKTQPDLRLVSNFSFLPSLSYSLDF